MLIGFIPMLIGLNSMPSGFKAMPIGFQSDSYRFKISARAGLQPVCQSAIAGLLPSVLTDGYKVLNKIGFSHILQISLSFEGNVAKAYCHCINNR